MLAFIRDETLGFIDWLGDGFILHHQNSPAAVERTYLRSGNGTIVHMCLGCIEA
jgi:hypothetical protein